MQNYSASLLNALRSLRSDPTAHDTRELDACEAAWLSGYFAGVSQAKLELARGEQPLTAAPRVAILYGSETGNAARVARQLGERARLAGTDVEVSDLAAYKPRALEREQTVVIVTSTHGDGTPPESARRFFEQLQAATAPRSLSQLRFAVLGLGDSSYEHFCRAARIVDERLAQLGAQRMLARVDCDVDFAESAAVWIEDLLPHLTRANAGQIQLVERTPQATAPLKAAPDEKRPFQATVLENFKLTGRGSSKETRHLALQVDETLLSFEPGDSIAICAPNDPALAHKLARSLGLNGDELVSVGDERMTLRSALIERVDLNLATPRFLREWARISGAALLMELCACPESEQRKFLRAHHVLDLVRLYPPSDASTEPAQLAELLVRGLRRLTPRLYSIASSAAAISDEVHLAIATVRYTLHGRHCSGVASGHIADRLREGDTLPVYVQPNPSFKLPADPHAKLLMIGAGTGVAPYRAFMQDRCARGVRGQSWLFFGERNFRSDFLYQTEWQDWIREGALSRISLAFSRDQATKIYVQGRLLEHADDVYAWLSEGAYVYVCGDASSMAHGVHEALLKIIERHTSSRERAEEYLHALTEARRYQRDVY